jgi:DNA replicative helicase MCM subunit Mcm2 (Cdc46/Mcm family)
MTMKDDIFGVYGSGYEHHDESKPMSVLQAKRVHNGKVTVLGTIVSISEMYILEVEDSTTHKKEAKDAKSIEIEDIEKLDENERLDVILYGDMVSSVIAGEVVKITGNMRIEDKKENARSKRKFNILHATFIEYVNRKEILITKDDIKNFHRFAELPNLIDRVVLMFSPDIVGHIEEKKGILRSIVGGIDRGKKSNGRVHTFLVGDPGTAKSMLTRESTEIKPNSRYVSAPHASTKTLTAIVEKENDSIVRRLGAIPLSSRAICGINEITSFPLEDQSRLLDVLEEGKFPLDKHGRHYDIPSPTTIIATANPIQGYWKNAQTIDNDEIELKKSLLNRFTQVFIFRDDITGAKTKEFVKEMSKIRRRRPHNYNFLKKYLIYASGMNVDVTVEAEYMLNNFWAEGKNSSLFGMRAYKDLFKIAEAQAKLQLKNEVDEDIAKQTIESVQLMMVQSGPTIGMVTGPRETAYNAFLEILQHTQASITLEELCKIACRDEQIADYLGTTWTVSQNKKLRSILKMLVNHSHIKVIGSKPIILKWISDLSDLSDLKTEKTQNQAQNPS